MSERIEYAIFAAFNPDADALLRLISRHIDDGILRMIARLDPVGPYVDDHFRELRKIRDGGAIARPITWQPGEVLEFASQRERDGERAPWNGSRGDWARAFAAAAMLRAYGDEETRGTCTGVYYTVLATLLESVRKLDAGLELAGMSSLAWLNLQLMNDYHNDEFERPFIGLGILALGTAAKTEAFDIPLVATARWLMDDEKRAFVEWGEGRHGHANHWLLRWQDVLYPEQWIALGRRLAQSVRPGPAGDAARAIGRRLSGEVRMTGDKRDDLKGSE